MATILPKAQGEGGGVEATPVVIVDTSGNPVAGGGGGSTGLTDAQLRTAPVPVSGPLTDTQLRANIVPVNTLGAVGVARSLAAAAVGGASASIALTTTTRRISIAARLSDQRYVIGTGAQTASAASHFIAAGERLDVAVPASAVVAVISATSTAGVLEITELT